MIFRAKTILPSTFNIGNPQNPAKFAESKRDLQYALAKMLTIFHICSSFVILRQFFAKFRSKSCFEKRDIFEDFRTL